MSRALQTASRGSDSPLVRFFLQEDINFLLTNRIPRRWATLFLGWFSRLESPLLTRVSLATWKLFARDLDLSEAKKTRFRSLHDCFTRELREGTREVDLDPHAVTSPCDGIVGACGRVEGTEVLQAKGFPYTLEDLLGDRELVERHRDGWYVTLRLKSSMYHRFHAPCDGRIASVRYIAGDTWNVNPIALERIERLFCKNERAVLDFELDAPDQALTLVPVAAILVASIRLHCIDRTLDLRYDGPAHIVCNRTAAKGEELGYFENGSTIILFASGDFELDPNVRPGTRLTMGSRLFKNRNPLSIPRIGTRYPAPPATRETRSE